MVERTKEDLMRLSDESLRGRTVISADGNAIGSLVELFLSSTDWRVEKLREAHRPPEGDGALPPRT